MLRYNSIWIVTKEKDRFLWNYIEKSLSISLLYLRKFLKMGLHLLLPIVIQDVQVFLLNLTKTSYPLKLDTFNNFLKLSERVVCLWRWPPVFHSKINTYFQNKVTWNEAFCPLLIVVLCNKIAISAQNKC